MVQTKAKDISPTHQKLHLSGGEGLRSDFEAHDLSILGGIA